MPTDACCFPYLGSLSFFNSHPFLSPSNRVSFSRLKSFGSSRVQFLIADRVHFERARSRITGHSRAGALVSFSIPFSTLRFDLNAMASFSRVDSGIRSCALFRKNVTDVRSSPRPRCLGSFKVGHIHVNPQNWSCQIMFVLCLIHFELTLPFMSTFINKMPI